MVEQNISVDLRAFMPLDPRYWTSGHGLALVPWCRSARLGKTFRVDFVTGVFAQWVLERLADGGRNRLVTFLLGDEQERALRSAAAAAISLTATDFCPADEAQAEHLAQVIDQVFTDAAPGRTMAECDTLLEALQTGIAAQLAPLGDADMTGMGLSSADLLGVRLDLLAGTLTSHVVREIIGRGAKGGPLTPLAIQIGHDVTHLQGQRIEAKMDQLLRVIGEELAQLSVTVGVGAGLTEQVVVGGIPREPPGFVVRQMIGRLADAAGHGRVAVVCAVTGLRGVGKTQVAAAYARFCVRKGWSLVGWVNAETRDGMVAGLARVAQRLGVADPEGDSLESARLLRDHLSTRTGASLLVFDNATDPDELRPLLPATGDTQVVVTSTDRSFAEFGEAVDVESFSRAESLAYLQERTGLNDEVGANAVAAELGDLPLGLAQAAATIRSQHLAYPIYLERLRLVPVTELLGVVPAGDYPYSAAAALLLSIQAAEASDPLGLVGQLLRVLAALSPDGVRRTLLYGLGDDVPGLETAVDTAVQRCVAASLLTWSVSGDAVIMHRLLRRVLRERDRADGKWPDTLRTTLEILERQLFAEHEAWARREEGAHLVTQVDALMGGDGTSSGDPDLILRQLKARSWGVWQLRATADLNRAVDLAKRILADCEQLLGAHNAQTLSSQNDLAEAFKAADRLDVAIDLFERTLADRERILGEDHADTMKSRDNLANAFTSMHRFEEAINLFERTLADREDILGEDHPDTMLSRSYVAEAYLSAGYVDVAIDLLERVLADQERILGEDHPNTIASRQYLGIAYERADYPIDDVIDLFERVLSDRERVLGTDHPDTLFSKSRLARAYFLADMLDEAIPLFERTLADYEQVLGPDHPGTLRARNHLALAYDAVGRFSESVPLYERTLAAHERTMGTDDPHVETLRKNLARAQGAYRNNGDAC